MNTPEELFALLSDETRLRCLFLLQNEEELCVCELTQVIESSQPKISRHLALLRQSGLVTDQRRGQWIYYRIGDKLPPSMHKILITVLEKLIDLEPYAKDLLKLKKLRGCDPCKS